MQEVAVLYLTLAVPWQMVCWLHYRTGGKLDFIVPGCMSNSFQFLKENHDAAAGKKITSSEALCHQALARLQKQTNISHHPLVLNLWPTLSVFQSSLREHRWRLILSWLFHLTLQRCLSSATDTEETEPSTVGSMVSFSNTGIRSEG